MANIQEVTGKNGAVKYRVLVRLKGCDPQSATFKRITDAKKWAQDTESAIRDGRHFKTAEAKRHTVSDMIDRYIKDVVSGKKSASDSTQQLLYWRGQIGSKLLSALTAPLIVGIRDCLKKEPYYTTRKTSDGIVRTERLRSDATVNRYLAALSHCMTTAVTQWGWMESNPMKTVTKAKEPAGRVRFLSDDERERLLKACQSSKNPLLYQAVVLAILTGARQSELLNLSWDDVDMTNGRALLHDTKNGEKRVVHLAGKALELLQALKGMKHRDDNNLVFQGRTALNKGHASLRTAWVYALKKAEVTDFRWHDLRHSAASYLAMNGAPLLDIAAVLGHKTLSMVKRYSHLSESHVGNVVASMNEKIFG